MYLFFHISSRDDDDEEDFSKGINAFVKNSTARRKARLDCEGPVEAHHVGIENRLLACATFKTYTYVSFEIRHHI